MKIKHLYLGFLYFLTAICVGQSTQNDVLFTIGDKSYYTDEFTRVYFKNLDLVKDEAQKDLDHYLDLFIGYKLKLNKAYALGLHENKKYITELKSYRNQLAKNYTTDTEVTEELVQEAFERMQKEVNAAHILIKIPDNATPEDTLKIYNRTIEIRNRALAGENFNDLAKEYSDDKSALENGGELGYFSAFRMVYPFETAAYNTAVGNISMPVRSRFGYHLVKVNKVRPHRGEVTVAHIMILNPAEESSEATAKASNTIHDIYKKIQQGEDFETLAKQFSQDRNSAANGGLLQRFGSGQLSSEIFENTAFSLTEAQPISKPIQSQFGWHIIKLIQKHPVKTFDELKVDIESKISKDERSKIIAASMNEKLRDKYSVKTNNKALKSLQKVLNDDFYKGTWKAPENKSPYEKEVILTIENNTFTSADFLEFLAGQQKGNQHFTSLDKLLKAKYEDYINVQLNKYYDDHLEQEFPEFAAVMEEYRGGLLLFDLMEKEIWERAKTDTIGLKKFYEVNQANYAWETRYDATIASTTNEKVAKKILAMMRDKQPVSIIKAAFNTDDNIAVIFNEGVFETNHPAIPQTTNVNKGISKIIKQDDHFYILDVKEILPAQSKKFEECKGKVINDFQQMMEENWVNALKTEFQVKVNYQVFEKLKANIKK